MAYEYENLFNLRKTLQTFLRVNEFDTDDDPDFNDENYSLAEFKRYHSSLVASPPAHISRFGEKKIAFPIDPRSVMSNIYASKNDKKERIFVFFLPDIKANVNQDVIIKFIRMPVEFDCTEALMISANLVKSSTSLNKIKKCNMQGYGKEGVYFYTVYEDDDFVDLTTHILFPKVLHVYRGKEAREFSERNDLKLNELTRMRIDDPVAKFYRARENDIFKIEEKVGIYEAVFSKRISYKVALNLNVKKKSGKKQVKT